MELIAAVLFAGPLGYLGASRRRGLGLYLAVWTVLFPIQTLVVHAEDPRDIGFAYIIVNALILALGIGLNQLGWRFRQRRSPRQVA
jgi:hypothetical protein